MARKSKSNATPAPVARSNRQKRKEAATLAAEAKAEEDRKARDVYATGFVRVVRRETGECQVHGARRHTARRLENRFLNAGVSQWRSTGLLVAGTYANQPMCFNEVQSALEFTGKKMSENLGDWAIRVSEGDEACRSCDRIYLWQDLMSDLAAWCPHEVVAWKLVAAMATRGAILDGGPIKGPHPLNKASARRWVDVDKSFLALAEKWQHSDKFWCYALGVCDLERWKDLVEYALVEYEVNSVVITVAASMTGQGFKDHELYDMARMMLA